MDYVVWKENGVWKGTNKDNYDRRIMNGRIMNASEVATFNGFKSFEELEEYIKTWFKMTVINKSNDL